MNKLEIKIKEYIVADHPNMNQIIQGAIISGIERVSGLPCPGPLTLTYGAAKAGLGYYGNKIGEFEMPVWKKMSLYALGTALPYADKIYCALAPTIETLVK